MSKNPASIETYENSDGSKTNIVTYDRTDGKGLDTVIQDKDSNNNETGHTTYHPDGTINTHGDHTDAWKS